MSLTIGSFNLYNFSSNEDRKYLKDYSVVADAIIRSDADVIALQEVVDDQAIESLMVQLRGYGGANRDWKSYFDKRQTWRNNREGYAFVWDEKSVTLVRDDDNNVVLPELMTRFTSLKRPPMVARFMTTRPGELHYELCVINTHIIFKPDKYQEQHPEWFGSAAMRAFEYTKIVDEIYPRYACHCNHYAVIAGDYNLSSSFLSCVNAREQQSSNQLKMMSVQSDKSTIKTIDPKEDLEGEAEPEESKESKGFFSAIFNGVFRLLGNGTDEHESESLVPAAEESQVDGAYVNDYDHFSFEKDRVGRYVSSSHRINAPEELFPALPFKFHTYKERVSDHVPVVAKFDFHTPNSI